MTVIYEHTPDAPARFHEYANLTISQRSMIAAKILNEAKERRLLWMQVARRAFKATERSPCEVCGGYSSVTQAHHVYPLSLQFQDGIEEAIHDHVWLCPTHHAVVHKLIDGLNDNLQPDLSGVPDKHVDACDKISALYVEARFK